eukprot:TRINITY_DN91457_c0_g1_i1.p1 TRINITY_DN91457_c0_g1~~TRINITY_DN91457_c0_g1_i1.p1  ORF type:complete len:309 (+),score=38.80 TRINITY_DN91457_c0_g1_i1:137-928(+)
MVFDQLRTKDLQKRLRDSADFVCVDAPILAEKSVDGNPLLDRRLWYSWHAEDPTKFEGLIHEQKLEWHKFEETCLYLEGVLSERGPFDGILGFSQGGNTAAVFMDQYLRQGRAASLSPAMMPRFLILISATLTPTPTNFPAFPEFTKYEPMAIDQDHHADAFAETASDATASTQDAVEQPKVPESPKAEQPVLRGAKKPVPDEVLPTLHIWGTADEYMPTARCEALAEAFVAPEIFVHDKGHSVPQNGAACKVYREFLERFLK